MRWLLIFVVTMIVFNALAARWPRRLLGRVPGDFCVRWGGREFQVPLGSSVVFSGVALLLGWLL